MISRSPSIRRVKSLHLAVVGKNVGGGGRGEVLSPRTALERFDMSSLFRIDLDNMLVDSLADTSDATEVSLLNATPYVDAWYFINEWFGKGFDICIYTDRDPKFKEVTERWLREWDIPYSELVFRKDA